jgi:ABC-type polysaccharide/polyol phosphate export permease
VDVNAAVEGRDAGLRVMQPVARRVRLAEIWTSFPVTRMVAARDMKIKYKQAALGPLWLVIAPLGLLAAVTIAFYGVTKVDTRGVPYVLFALVGLCVWIYLQLTLMTAPLALVQNAVLVRRSACPRIALVNATLISNGPPLAVTLAVTLVGIAADRGLPLRALLLPLLLAWLVVLAWGAVVLLAALAARFRDIVSIVPLIVQAGIFVTPVGYSLQGAPANIHRVLALNPATGVIEAWRWSLLDLPDPDVTVIGIAVAWTILLAALAWYVFGRLEVRLADYI